MQKLLKDHSKYYHMILVFGQFLGMFGCSSQHSPIVGEKSLGACDRLTQSVFRRFEKKTLTLMSSAFSPCLTATKVSIADGPFESKVVKSSSDIDINKMA